ncbi:hypothetical protein SAY87_027649 [Trapa incisa]|uniref:Uncharacterized protein n=1 Tax=Trapa incisa TaxID=236973 RepID=A0AAN7PQT3_9MYRT|nr:hypothetical protein SAY87_027649 [Trapa incisa]
MVLKNLDNGGKNGFHVPVIPRAPRSARRRGPHEKVIDNNEICAIELLASIAGKLLQEGGSSASSSASENKHNTLIVGEGIIKSQSKDEVKLIKAEPFDSVNRKDSASVLEQVLEKGDIGGSRDTKPIIHEGKIQRQSCDINYGRETEDVEPMEKKNHIGNVHGVISSVECHSSSAARMVLDRKIRFDTKLGRIDDDGNFSNYNRLCNKFRSPRHPETVGIHRIRKSMTFKHWKTSSKFRDYEHTKAYGGKHSFFGKRKTCFNHERSIWNLPYKRRRLFDRGSILNSDNIHNRQCVKIPGISDAKGVSSSMLSRETSFHAKDSRVKFSIKSIKIPELLIEVPQTATVGSLKRTVMEAVNAILGDGLRVGMVLEGEKIWDDSRTLLQSGISCKDNVDTLGFTLEPCSMSLPQITASEAKAVHISPRDKPLVLARSPDDSSLDPITFNPVPGPPPSIKLGNGAECNSTVSDVITEKTAPESRALVLVPQASSRAPSSVEMNQKGQRTDMAQRRTRRPFSVAEVEALVQAVEELGTGRWRDVKLRAFETAVHRTYVDLKDKWKTLVHTASILPQQRRGEPVPQELLDRVLSAHAFWSQCNKKLPKYDERK